MAAKSFWDLRTKTLVAIGLILVALIAALYVATSRILFTSFAKVEKSQVERNVSRVTDAIGDETAGIVNFTGDYSDWNDAENFIQHPNQDFIDSNLIPQTYENLILNHFAFINSAGKLVYGQDYNLKTGKLMPLSPILKSHLSNSDILLQHKNHDDIKSGFIMLENGPALVSSRPSMDSNGEGPIRGTVLMARDFSQDRINNLSDKTHLKVTSFPLNQTLTGDEALAKAQITAKEPIFTKPINNQAIYGYTILDDIYGKPVILLRVEVPREIYQQGLAARRYLIISLLSIGIIFLVIALILVTNLYHRDQEVSQLKDRFIQIASHELRTPLTSIRGGADLLPLAKTPEKVDAAHRLITDGIFRLSHLIDELINLSTLEKGSLSPTLESIDIGATVKEAADAQATTATSKGLTFETTVQPGLPQIKADPRLLRSAVLNLTNNAIKFTQVGGIKVNVSQRDNEIAISVSDTGPGIKEADSYLLFQKFSKLASASQPFQEGHGLGLYLTKLAVDAHHGKIEVNSSPKGTTFTILLPVQA